MNDIKARHSAIDDLQNSSAVMSPVIDEFTKRGHERFKKVTSFTCSDGKVRTFVDWLEWMKTWNPETTDPVTFEGLQKMHLAEIQQERRGPGITKRPRSRPATRKKTP